MPHVKIAVAVWYVCLTIGYPKMVLAKPDSIISISSMQRVYSKSVGDSFSVFIHLPLEYNSDRQQKYPIVYLLDANLYFDIVAATMGKYEELGILPPAILVGIGYRDFSQMDSLRNRDLTYPAALPQYEMSVSGGAEKFLSFIRNELVPDVEGRFRGDTKKRILAGHSLGGYFVFYTLLQTQTGGTNFFRNYIAASPALHYNKYYLLGRLKNFPLGTASKNTSLYLTFGGLEDSEDDDEPGMIKVDTLVRQLSVMMPAGIKYKADIFSNLGHLDTPIPTFIKGLHRALGKNEK